MVDARTALEDFKKDGETEEVSGLPSTPVIDLKRKEGNFFTGVYMGRRELIASKAGVSVLQFKFGSTNASITKKKGNEYPEVKVDEGDKVTVFASTQLDRKFKEIKEGTQVFVEYLGKKTDVINGRKVTSHRFTVRAKVNAQVENSNDEVPL